MGFVSNLRTWDISQCNSSTSLKFSKENSHITNTMPETRSNPTAETEVEKPEVVEKTEKVNDKKEEKEEETKSESGAEEDGEEKEETNKENDEKENGDDVVSPRKRGPEDVIKDDISPSKKTKTAESEEEKKEVVEPES